MQEVGIHLHERLAALETRQRAIDERRAAIVRRLTELAARRRAIEAGGPRSERLDSWHVLDAERRRRAAARQAEWALAHSAEAHRRASELHRWLADRGGPEAATHRAKADRHAADAVADDRRREHLAGE